MTAHHARTLQSSDAIAPEDPEFRPDLPQSKANHDDDAGPVPPPGADAHSTSAARPADPEVVSIVKYQAVVNELARYKAFFGELPELSTPATEGPTDQNQPLTTASPEDAESPPASPLSPLSSSPEDSVNPEQSREEAEQLLSILSVNDRDLAHEVNDLKELLNISSSPPNSPLKHFGFQRGKSANQ